MADTTPSSRIMPYLPVGTPSLNKERKVTDLGFLVIFFLVLLAWISLCLINIAAATDSESSPSNKNHDPNKNYDQNKNHDASLVHATVTKTFVLRFDGIGSDNEGHGEPSNIHRELSTSPFMYTNEIKISLDGLTLYTFAVINQWGLPIVLLSALGGLIAALISILLVRLIPQFWVFLAILCVMLGIVALVFVDISVFPSDWKFFNTKQIWDIFRINLYGIICIFTLISILRVKTNIIAEYARKICQPLFYFPSAVVFGLFILFLDLFIAISTRSSLSFNANSAAYFPIKLTSLYLRNFIYYFGLMVYAQFIGSYHSMKNVDASSRISLFHAVTTIARYHTGTAAFAATIILPLLLSIYILFKHTAHYATTTLESFIEISWKILLLFGGIIDVALVETSFKGMNLYDATKRVFDITSKKSTLALAVCQILTCITALGMGLSLLGAAVIPHFAFNISMDKSILISIGAIVFLHLPVLLLVATSIIATIVYHIDADEDNKSPQRPSHIPLNGLVTH